MSGQTVAAGAYSMRQLRLRIARSRQRMNCAPRNWNTPPSKRLSTQTKSCIHYILLVRLIVRLIALLKISMYNIEYRQPHSGLPAFPAPACFLHAS